MNITHAELQDHIDRTVRDLEADGYFPTIESDMTAWVKFMESAPDRASVAPTYDPRVSLTSRSTCFWIAARLSEGGIVGCVATRLFQNGNLMDLLLSNRIWWDRGPVEVRPIKLVHPDRLEAVRAPFTLTGGFYARPEHRGSMPAKLVRLMQLVGARELRPEHDVIFSRPWLFTKGLMQRDGYDSFQLNEGIYPPVGDQVMYVGIRTPWVPS